MTQSRLPLRRIGEVFLFVLLLSPMPVFGQFILPFLYMPLKTLFQSDLGTLPKHLKVTSQHVRTSEGWTAVQTYNQTMAELQLKAVILLAPSSFTAVNLADLDYYWSYNIPNSALNTSLSDKSFIGPKTAAFMQEELLKFVSQKFAFDINKVAASLSIPAAHLWDSYDPANWEAVVHAIISESSSAFSRRLAVPSVNSLAKLVDMPAQDLLNVTLSRFEDLVFPFIHKKAILDVKMTSYLINTSGIVPGESYNNVNVAKILQQHENLTLSLKEFGILYNLTTEQARVIDQTTFYQIFHLCDVSIETILQITLPEVAWRVVGSTYITPPCPSLVGIKGKPVASYDSVINPQTTTVLEILAIASNLTWREAHEAVSVSLPEWEFLDSVTLLQLAEISDNSLETLLNDSASQAVELVLRLRTDGSLNNKTTVHRAFIRKLLEEKFNLTLREAANLTQTLESSFSNTSSPLLFRNFLNATITYFGLNLSEIVDSLQIPEEALYNLPRQEWESVISAIINPVVKSEAALLQISTDTLLRYLAVASAELSISQLKELVKNQILVAKRNKRKFEADPISVYLSQHSVSDAEYLNSTVLSLVLAASSFSSDDLKLIYGFSSDEIFILASLRISELPLYCTLNTSVLMERTPFNITAELAGISGVQAVCRSTRFYLAARHKNMSLLRSEFSQFSNSSVSLVNLVEKVTRLPWRRNVWAFGLKMEDWTVLYVLNEVSYTEVTSGLDLNPYQSRTLLQIFEKSVELYEDNNANLRRKIQENRDQTLNIIYGLFNTSENELIQVIPETKAQYDVLYPIEVFSRMIEYYLVGKFNVFVSSLESSLDLKTGDLNKLAPTEWPEMIPFVKAEVIRSGQDQLGVSLSNFATLLEETPQGLQSLTFGQLKSKWDNVVSRLKSGKTSLETQSVFENIASIGITSDSLNDVTVLQFIEGRINVRRSEILLLYNFSSIAIDVLSNYTFVELPGFCNFSKEILFSKRPLEIVVSLLGLNNDVSCRKIAAVALASTITVNELATKFSLDVEDNINLLTLFEDLFSVPWPKIAWAVNALLPDWPILGAVTLDDVASLTSQSTQNMKSQKSFRMITMQLLSVPSSSYTQLMSTYRSKVGNQASNLFGVNASKICDGCEVIDILWNSLTQLHLLIDLDPYKLPNELNVSPYEFNLTVPSQWSLLVQPIVSEAYVRAALALGIDRDRLSSLLQTTTAAVQSLNLTQYQAFLNQSIRPLLAAKTALTSSPLADLIAAKGLHLSALTNTSVFDVIDAVLSVSVQNISFIFSWTAAQQAKLKNYTLDDMAYYRGVELQSLDMETLFTLVEYILPRIFPPRTPPPPPPCKRGFERVGNGADCIDINECSSLKRCGDDSLCQNYPGGFQCECKTPGHFKVIINGNCKPCKTFSGTLTITNKVFSSLLNDKSTEDFYVLKESFETTVNDELKKSLVSQYYYGCRVQDFRSGSVIVDFLIFTSPNFAGSIQDLQNALVSRINNTKLGPHTVTPSEVAVEDFDDCKAHQDNCGQHATCENKEGSFECKCNDGFDGDGVTCEAGFLKTMWWTVIVAAFLLLLIVIIIVCLVIKRPKPSGRYGMETDDPGNKNQPNKRNSAATNVSYRNGDVYYKDKDGNLRSGTANRLNNLNPGNGIEQKPHTSHFHEDDLQSTNGMGAKTPFELAVERNKRISGEYSSSSRSPFEVSVERNARNGNLYETTEELNMTDLPIASITS